MRIIDSRKDYYDCIQGQGIDPTCLFIRREETIEYKGNLPNYLEHWHSVPMRWSCYLFVIGFCGKLYPVAEVTEGLARNTQYHYSEESLAAVWPKRKMSAREASLGKGKSRIGSSWGDRRSFFEWIHDYKPNDLLEQYPIFVYKPITNHWQDTKQVIVNPLLNQFDFQKVFHPWQAYQELQVWFANKARPMKPIPEIDDKTRAEIHGFNRFSFRKEKRK